MKTNQFFPTILRKGFLLATSLLVVLASVLVVPSTTALAAGEALPSNSALTRAYQHDQAWLNLQQTNLGKSGDLVPVVQNLISAAQANSLDTTDLANALAIYQGQLITAGASHTTAANVLSTHAGFDGSGNVTDPVAAAQTVQDATQALQEAHTTLVQSLKDLLTAIKVFENANPVFKQIDALSVALKDDQDWLSAQQKNLDKAGVVVTDVQNLITLAQANALKTGLLSGALTGFQTRIGKAQTAHTTADGILSTHAGFDASGNVTNVADAAKTIKDASTALLTAHTNLGLAAGGMLIALEAWRFDKHIPASSPVAAAYATAHAAAHDLNVSVNVEAAHKVPGLIDRLTNLLNVLAGEL